MPSFVMQPGVPLVTVARGCTDDKMALELAQQRFLVSAASDGAKQGEVWSIPICIKPTNTGESCFLQQKRNARFAINACPDWFFANRDAKGYYRVFYQDPEELIHVARAAKKDLTVPERIAFVEDLWAMVRAGKNTVGIFLDVARALRAERNRLVVESIADHMDTIGRSLVPEQKQNDFRAIVQQQFAPLEKEVGWASSANDDDEQKALRASLLGILGSAGDPEAVTAAQKITQAYIKDPGAVEGTIIAPALAVAAENGDAALYEQFMQAMASARNTEDYYHFLFALTSFRQPELAQRTLALTDQGKIRQQDYVRIFPALLAESPAREIAWDYLKAHWDVLAEKVTTFGGGGAVSALGGFCSIEKRDEIKQFFAAHRAPGAERALQQSLERIATCVQFKQLQSENMQKFLQQTP
jgi:aminopeptidase N/puromycin-sensitive aminopeptidase